MIPESEIPEEFKWILDLKPQLNVPEWMLSGVEQCTISNDKHIVTYSTVNGGIQKDSIMVSKNPTLEYAKKTAIGFAKFTCERLWTCFADKWFPYMDGDNPISGEQLFELYLQSLKQ